MRMSVKKRLRNSGNKYGFAIKLLFVGCQYDTSFFLSKINTNLSKNNKNILQFNHNHDIVYSTLNWKTDFQFAKVNPCS